MDTKTCKKCKLDKPAEDYSISRMVAGTVYRHSICRSCRRTKPWGFMERLSDDERKRLLDNEDDFKVLSRCDYHEQVGLSMTLPQFYRYCRQGDFEKFFKAHGKAKDTPEPPAP
jgi:hypothetical protein